MAGTGHPPPCSSGLPKVILRAGKCTGTFFGVADGVPRSWVLGQWAAASKAMLESGEHVVQHTSKTVCGQIGSHKVRQRYRITRSAWRHAPHLLLGIPDGCLGWPIAACCRYACIRLHDWRSWGLHGHPSASLIYAPAIQVRGPLQGSAPLTKLASSKPSLHEARPGAFHKGLRARSTSLPDVMRYICSIVVSQGTGLPIPNGYHG